MFISGMFLMLAGGVIIGDGFADDSLTAITGGLILLSGCIIASIAEVCNSITKYRGTKQ